jgi:hypothetical protein
MSVLSRPEFHNEEATVHTDEASHYRGIAGDFAGHGFVRHSADEYVRGNVHTNTIEGFSPIFRRDMKGVCQHCGKKHLYRYMAEFDFRYSNKDVARELGTDEFDDALDRIMGKLA